MSDVLSIAESELGKPYVWRGAGPDVFDCSGLIQWVYGQAGLKIPRTSREQKAAGTQVSMAQAQPGDLVLYTYYGQADNPPPANHVGLYVRPGVMIDAPHSGANVRYDPIDTAHLDSVVHINGSTGRTGTAENAIRAQQAAQSAGLTTGLDIGSWPGDLLAPIGGIFGSLADGAGNAIGGIASSIMQAVLTAIGPIILMGLSLTFAGGLILMGLWRMTQGGRSAVQTIGKAARVAV